MRIDNTGWNKQWVLKHKSVEAFQKSKSARGLISHIAAENRDQYLKDIYSEASKGQAVKPKPEVVNKPSFSEPKKDKGTAQTEKQGSAK